MRGLIAVGVAMAASACAVFDGATSRFERTVALDPRIVAWIVADLACTAHPIVDPVPGRGSVPIVAASDGTLTFSIARDTAQAGYRCATNGRLLRPASTVAADGRMSYVARDVLDVGEATVCRGRFDRIDVVVERSRDARTRLSITTSPSHSTRPLIARMLAAVDALDTADQMSAAIDIGAAAHALDLEAAFTDRLDGTGIAGIDEALVPLRAAGAVARRALGDLAGARAMMSTAAASTPRVAMLRTHVARLDEEAAHVADAVRTWEALAADASTAVVARIAAHRATAARELLEVARDAEAAGRLAERFARAGDEESARAWACQAHAAAGTRLPDMEIALARALGDHRTAFVLGLERVLSEGSDPASVVELARDAAAYGDPAAGLRVLARFGGGFATNSRVREFAGVLVAAVGMERASQILTSELIPDDVAVAATVLGIGPSWESVARREAALRALGSPLRPARLEFGDAFELAPGVAPVR